jgi:hypothetical protein
MKTFKQLIDERCWPGYKPAPGKKPYSPGSCVKEEVEQIDEISSKLAGEYYGAATKQHIKKVGIKPNMYDRIEKDMGKQRKAGVDRALDRVTGVRKTNEEREGDAGGADNPVFTKPKMMKVKKEEVETLDEKMISVQNADGHLLKVASQFKDIYKKHGYKPVPGTREEAYEPDDGPLTQEQLEQLEEGEAWTRKEGQSESGGLNRKGIESYRRANPGSKLSMAVTTKPSKLKPGSKAANRRKSFCSRMSGLKRKLTSSKTANDPNSRVNKALRKWNC